MIQRDARQHIKHYMRFKQQLLTAMTELDPLAILQSQIFQKYQTHLSNLTPPNPYFHSHNTTILNNTNDLTHEMQTKITTYNIDELKVNVVERRSHSCDLVKCDRNGSDKEGERKWRNRVRKLEEQQKIDLMIWSNIMNNHFRVQEINGIKGGFVRKGSGREIENDMRESNIDNRMKNYEKRTPSKLKSPKKDPTQQCLTDRSELESSTFLANSITSNSQTQTLIKQISLKILQNPTKINIQLLMKELFTNIEQDNEKIIGQLNKLRKQNDRLTKNIQEKSMNELQYIVQIKHLEKKIQQKDEQINSHLNKIRQKQQQIRDRQSQLNKIIRKKLRQIQNLQQENIRKNSIQQLKQKLAIDSIRRATLCSLSKQRFEIELKKEELGLCVESNVYVGEFEEGGEVTQETRCDDDQ